MNEPINWKLNFDDGLTEDQWVHSSCPLAEILWCLVPSDERQLCMEVAKSKGTRTLSYDLQIHGQKCMFL